MDSQRNIVSIGEPLVFPECKFIPWNTREPFPQNILEAGTDVGGQSIYLGLVNHDNHKLPAKVVPVAERIYTSYDGIEYQKGDAFLLVDDGNFTWKFNTRGNVPQTAVKFGNLNGCDALYVGSTLYELSETPGAIYPTQRVLRIPFGGGEVEFNEYRVLCRKSPATIPSEESVAESPERTPDCATRFCDLLGALINRILPR